MIMSGTWKELEAIRVEEEDLEIKKRYWLEACGWKTSCDVPGSFWLFQKKLKDRRTVMANASLAISIERNIPR